VPAGELRVGETLRNLDGDVRIESIEQLGSEERVYNLEIHGEHVFRVASSGLLVHNSSGAQANAPSSGGKVHSVYEDGTQVLAGQQPPRLGAAKPTPGAEGSHTQLRWDTKNNRVYQGREFDSNGNPVRDLDFTSPTFPNGKPRPDHLPPPHQHDWIPNDPNNPSAGFRRSKDPTPFAR
jgi:hypothetical protein